ncbi:acylamino-acid-releasing enzyme isoform X2 [Aphelocoma coerulescens]|uniref:acylamino-acid-releasing enzyme isoform X2 n=1 Tax=Aphelocoma coerulescens TaxID=39617 RepID=UPI0036051E12
MRGSGSSWRAATGRGAGAGLLLRALAGVPLRAAENIPMATGATEKGVEHAPSLIQAADGPAACYRELSRFPAVTRAALRAAAGGQTFLLYTGSSARTRPRGSAAPCSNAARGRATSCWRCGTAGDAATAWISRRWGSTGRSTRRGPLPAWPGHTQRHGSSMWLRRASPNDSPPAPGMCQEQPGQQQRMRMRRSGWGTRNTPGGPAWGCGMSLAVTQALWSPNDHGVVFVGWWHKPFRLGLNACSNRRSGIFHLDLASGCCELLSAENGSACSPQLSPDGQRLLYLEGVVGGPHRQCLCLRMVTWQTRQTVTVLDVVQEPTEAFAGLYAEVLPPRCWAADSRRAVLGTPQRSRTDLLLVDTEAATVTNLTAGSPEGCWELLTLQWDLLVATRSAPHHPPSLVVAVLPPAGQELPLDWVPVEDTPTVPGVTWKTLTVQPPCSGQGPAAQDTQDFEALLLSPSDGTPPHPLVVCPHGGPHAVFDARWRPSMAALCRLGFAVLLVNYRGSLGFGQASISSLLSRVGEQDVADTQLAVEQALHREPLDPHRLALLAGSHGAFIALHLLTREPERYQACALRSPVSNLPALLGTSDIPDCGCHVPRRWPPCYCVRPSPRQPRCRHQCCCVWAPGTGASAPCRRWSCTGCCGPGVCQHGCCGTRRAATHWLVWRRRPMSSRTVPTGSSSTWGSPERMGQAGTGPSAHSGPGLYQPQGDCWPWGPHQDQRQMERV